MQRPLHSTKCTGWVAVSKNCIVDPYWFEDGNEKSQTVNTERYVTILRKFCASLSRHRGINRDEQWFQHYGATHYTSNDSFAWLRKWSQERLISRKCDVKWALHSPNLNTQILSVGVSQQGPIKGGGQRGQLPRALRSKGALVMTFICFK